jgi:hypothetical protein
MSKTPNSGQQTQLAVLQAAVISTAATEAAAIASYNTTKLALIQIFLR